MACKRCNNVDPEICRMCGAHDYEEKSRRGSKAIMYMMDSSRDDIFHDFDSFMIPDEVYEMRKSNIA